MAWETIAIDTVKGVLLLAALAIVKYARKKAFPLYLLLKKFSELVGRVDVIDIDVSILKSKQMAALHTDPDPVFIMKSEGQLIYANPAWCDMTGFNDIVEANDRDYMEEMLENTPSYGGEIKFINVKSKLPVYTISRNELIHDKEGKVVEIIWRTKIKTI